MKCCIITPYPPDRCGIAVYSKSLISKLSKHIEISVIANKYRKKNSIEVENRVRIIRCWRRRTVTCFPRIFMAVAREKPTIIHIQHEYLVYGVRKYSALFPLLLILLKFLRKPIVVTMHSVIIPDRACERFFREHGVGGRFATLKRGLTVFITRLIHMLSDTVIVHKNLMKNILVTQYGFREDKVRVIPHGVKAGKLVKEAKCELGLKDWVILFVGFIIPGKGIEILIKAFSKLLKSGHDATLVIAGGYHPRLRMERRWFIGSIERAVKENNVEGKVIFLNRFIPEEELDLFISAADIVALPYTDDSIAGASGALARCAPLGKPIIATAIPRFLEDLVDEVNALIVKPGDADELANAMIRLIRNPFLRGTISEGVRKWASERRWSRVALETVSLYKELVKRRHSNLL